MHASDDYMYKLTDKLAYDFAKAYAAMYVECKVTQMDYYAIGLFSPAIAHRIAEKFGTGILAGKVEKGLITKFAPALAGAMVAAGISVGPAPVGAYPYGSAEFHRFVQDSYEATGKGDPKGFHQWMDGMAALSGKPVRRTSSTSWTDKLEAQRSCEAASQRCCPEPPPSAGK